MTPSPPPDPARPRRRRLAGAVLALGLVAAAACGGDDGDRPAAGATTAADGEVPPGTVLRVGDQGQGLQLPLELTGQLDDLPYEIELAQFGSGPLLNEALAAGAVDVGIMGDTPALLSYASGLETVVVGVRESDGPGATLIAAPGSGIESLEDLEGHRVAYTTGTNQHGFVLRALDSVGLTEDDIEQVDVPLTDVTAVLASGEADAAVVYDLFRPAYLAEHPDAVELVTVQDLAANYVFLVADRAAAEDPAKALAIEDLIRRLDAAADEIAEDPEAWVQAYYVERLHQTPEIGRAAHEANGDSAWVPIDDAVREHQQTQADLFHEAGFFPEPIDLGPQFDPAITERFSRVVAEEAGR